jgi:hypothetical protein
MFFFVSFTETRQKKTQNSRKRITKAITMTRSCEVSFSSEQSTPHTRLHYLQEIKLKYEIEVFITVTIMITVFCDVTPFGLEKSTIVPRVDGHDTFF